MTLSTHAKLLSPEEIAVRAGEQLRFLRVPEPGVFAERELRLRQLAAGHAMRDYLLFCAELAHAQHELLKAPVDLPLPSAEQIETAANQGLPLLDATRWPRDPQWRAGLRQLMSIVATRVPAGPARETAQALAEAGDAHLEAQAERLLGGVMLGLDLGTAPLVAAALQLHWVRLIQHVQARHERAQADTGIAGLQPFGRVDVPTLCPCCGSRPTASIIRVGADTTGVRYLSCSLCASQWHFVRIKCTHCQTTQGISYQALQQDGGEPADPKASPLNAAVQAECCDQCGHYLKIVHMEKDNQVEPHADDLASLTLDLLVSDTGLERHGINLMLLFGDPEPGGGADDPPPDPGGS